jgi:hypothetical protein
MGLEKQAQEIGLKVRGFARAGSVPTTVAKYISLAMSAVMPAVCSQDWRASLLCDGSFQHS